MTKRANILIRSGVSVVLLFAQYAAAQGKHDAAPAPIPAQIATAHRVFIANAGGDDPFPTEMHLFSGGVDRPYNEFYAAIKNSGRYDIVGSPSEADLLFEIRFAVMTGPLCRDSGGYDSQFRLEIRDAKTNSLLWTFTEHVPWAILDGNRNKNFDQALARVVTDVLGLATRASSGAASAKP